MTTQADVRRRMAVEKQILRATIEVLLAAGYLVSVNNEGVNNVYEIGPSRDLEPILVAAMQTDDEWITVHRSEDPTGLPWGWVRFVYGNDGWDVINDYTTNLEDVLKPVNDLCDRLGDGR